MDNISFTNNLVCSICLENLDFQIKNSTIETPCNHCFHNNCLEQWLNNHSTCPYCRFSIRESNYDSDDDLPDLEHVHPYVDDVYLHPYVDDVYVFTLLNNNNNLNNIINQEINNNNNNNNNNNLNNMINQQINNLIDINMDNILFNEIINNINNIDINIINNIINNSINNTNNNTYIDNIYDDLPELELIQQT
jgi:PHP family Zn ribbon phosphoesterase